MNLTDFPPSLDLPGRRPTWLSRKALAGVVGLLVAIWVQSPMFILAAILVIAWQLGWQHRAWYAVACVALGVLIATSASIGPVVQQTAHGTTRAVQTQWQQLVGGLPGIGQDSTGPDGTGRVDPKPPAHH